MERNVRMKKLGTLLLIVIIMLVFPSSSCGEEVDNNKKTFLFLGNENSPPLIYTDNNEPKGLVVDIVKELSEKSDYNIEVHTMNWEEAQNKVLLGQADGLLHINPNPEREKLFDFSTKLIESEFSIFKRTGDLNIYGIHNLGNKRVGVERVGYPRYLLEQYNDISIVTIPDWISGFEMVQSGSLDAVVVDRWIGEYALAKSQISGIQVVDEPIETRESYIAVVKGNDELLDLINRGLKEMKQDGSMERILSKWSGENIVYLTKSQIKRNTYYTLVGILALFIIAAIYVVTKLSRTNHELELMVAERTKELYEANEKLKKLSKIDALTNIYNRGHFDLLFEKSWKISLREKQPLSVILLDIDHFKRCNDTYGHLAGDCCLEVVAYILKKSVKRSGDVVARFGGEEFVILLYNTPEEGAQLLAEKIRKTIEKETIEYEGEKIRITASLGVASLIPSKDLGAIDLVRLADQAMYQAKAKGRNLVIVSDGNIDSQECHVLCP